MWRGRREPGQTVELRFGLLAARASSRPGDEPATATARRRPRPRFDQPRRDDARAAHLAQAPRARSRSRRLRAERQTVFSTALYHSLIKPCLRRRREPVLADATAPSPSTSARCGTSTAPSCRCSPRSCPTRAVELANALLTICEEEGNFPIGYRMAKGSDRFSRQGSALAHTFLADLCQLGLPGIDWEWALVHMADDLRRTYGEEFLLRGEAHPISHTLDLAFGYCCTAKVAPARRRHRARRAARGARRPAGSTPSTRRAGLLETPPTTRAAGTTTRSGCCTTWPRRIELSGGDDAFVAQLDAFFGYGADAVDAAGRPARASPRCSRATRSDRFEGLNNEPDMEAPWAYHYAGRPDRTAEIVHDVCSSSSAPAAAACPATTTPAA